MKQTLTSPPQANPYEPLNQAIDRANQILGALPVKAEASVEVADIGGRLIYRRNGQAGCALFYQPPPSVRNELDDPRPLRECSVDVKAAACLYVPSLFPAIVSAREEAVKKALHSAKLLNDYLDARTALDVQA